MSTIVWLASTEHCLELFCLAILKLRENTLFVHVNYIYVSIVFKFSYLQISLNQKQELFDNWL